MSNNGHDSVSGEMIETERTQLGMVNVARGCLAACAGLITALCIAVGIFALVGSGVANMVDVRTLGTVVPGILFFGGGTIYLITKAFPPAIIFRPHELVVVRPLRRRRTIAHAELAGVWAGTKTDTLIAGEARANEEFPVLFFDLKGGEEIAVYAPDESVRTSIIDRVRTILDRDK